VGFVVQERLNQVALAFGAESADGCLSALKVWRN
jgi:hypothetical protein